MATLSERLRHTGERIVASGRALSDIWVPDSLSPLEKYLLEKKNPYIANILVSIDRNHRGNQSPISVEDAIGVINSKKGIEGVLELFQYIVVADVFSGATARGFFHVGAYEALYEKRAKTKKHTGASIGAYPAFARATLNQELGLPNFRTSPEDIIHFSKDLRDSIAKMKWWQKYIVAYLRGRFGEAFISTFPMQKFLKETFGELRLGEISGDLLIPVCDYRAGDESENGIVYAPKTHPDELVRKIFERTTAAPRLLQLPREQGHIFADGGLYSNFPIELVNDADLILGFALNYYIPEIRQDKSKPGKGEYVVEDRFGGFWGAINQHDRDYQLMQKRFIEKDVKVMTEESPPQVAKYGDRKGKLFLILPNLSKIDPRDFFKTEGLIEPGREQTIEGFNKFFDPSYVHPEYDAAYFLARYYESRLLWNRLNSLKERKGLGNGHQ